MKASSQKLVRAQYRSLLRQAQLLQKSNKILYVQDLPSSTKFQVSREFANNADFLSYSVPGNLLIFFDPSTHSEVLTGNRLKEVIKLAYRKEFIGGNVVDLGFSAIKFLAEQVRVNSFSSISESHGIRIICTPIFEEIGSSAENRVFPYFYRIIVHNSNDHNMQVVGRHWEFKSASHSLSVPKFSPGLIGLKPIIPSGGTFQYMSSTVLKDPEGSMKGTFLVYNHKIKDAVEVDIAECQLKPTNVFK